MTDQIVDSCSDGPVLVVEDIVNQGLPCWSVISTGITVVSSPTLISSRKGLVSTSATGISIFSNWASRLNVVWA